MGEALPDPLVSLEVDLRDFAFMPLDVLRLRDSDLATLATGDEFKAAVMLWCAAWHQIPAGSVPNDDRWLARHSGAGPAWKKVKDEALRGFVECSDGRLYHQVVSTKAIESWGKKQEQRAKTLKARIAGINKRLAEAVTAEEKEHLTGLLQTMSQSLSQAYYASVTRPVTDRVTASKGTIRDSKGTGKGQGRESEVKGYVLDLSLSATAEKPAASAPGKTVETWNAYSSAYRERYSVEPIRNAKINGQFGKLIDQLGVEEAPKVAAFYLEHNGGLYVSSGHCVDLLLRDCAKLHTEMLTGRKITRLEVKNLEQKDALREQSNRVGRILEGAKP